MTMTPTSRYAEWLAVAKFSYMLYFYFLLTGTLLLTCMIQDKIQYHKTITSSTKIFKMQLFISEHVNAKPGNAQKNVSSDTMVLEIVPYLITG